MRDKLTSELAAILDSKTINKIYKDGLVQPVKESGEILTDVIKTARLFTAPFQLAAAYQDRFRAWIDQVIRKVPENRRIVAPSQIAGPIFDELRYLDEGDIVADMYLNLLARAIDKDRVSEAHPAFVKLIGFLSPDEALMLHLLGQKCFEETYQSDLDLEVQKFKNKRIILREFPVDDLVFPSNYYMYTSHLISLNLISFPVYQQVPTRDESNSYQTGEIGHARLILTDFGRMFVNACEPGVKL